MQRRNILLGTLAITVVVAAIGGVAYALHTRALDTCAQADGASYPGLDAPVCVVCPGPTYSTTGHPVIRPRNDCTPSFTQQDVRDYVAHGVRLGSIWVEGQPTVTRVVFLTIGDLGRASRDMGSELNYPADMLVCYVGLSGTFSFSSGFDPPHSLSAVSIVFDAHTGNELVNTTYAPLG